MASKVSDLITYVILGFMMPVGIPYFYLRKFNTGLVFIVSQTIAATVVLTIFDLSLTTFIASFGLSYSIHDMAVQSVLENGLTAMVPLYWLYPLVFVPALIQAGHVFYLILSKNV